MMVRKITSNMRFAVVYKDQNSKVFFLAFRSNMFIPQKAIRFGKIFIRTGVSIFAIKPELKNEA